MKFDADFGSLAKFQINHQTLISTKSGFTDFALYKLLS